MGCSINTLLQMIKKGVIHQTFRDLVITPIYDNAHNLIINIKHIYRNISIKFHLQTQC